MKRVLISSLLVLLTICLFVSCSSSPKEIEKEVTFQFVDYGTTPPKTTNYTKVFSEDKWGDMLKDYGTITIEGTEYTMQYNQTTDSWFFINPLCCLYTDISSASFVLKSEDEIKDGMIIYCVCAL